MKKLFILLTLTLLVGCGKGEVTNENNRGSNFNSDSNSNQQEVEPNSNTSSLTYKYDKADVGKYPVTLYLFYNSTCPHCHDELEWLDTIETTYPFLKIEKYEAASNISLFELVNDKMDINSEYVPLTIIGNDYYIGYGDSDSDRFINLFEYYSTFDSCDVVNTIKVSGDVAACRAKNQKK